MKSGTERSKRSKSKKTLCIPLAALLILSWASSVWGEQADKELKIVFLRTTSYITMETARQIFELMLHNVGEYSSTEILLTVKAADADFFQHYEISGDLHIQKKISRYECDYLFFIRKINPDYLSAVLWSKELILDHEYISYNEDMHIFLPDIAAGAFLSLLYQAESRFWINKLY